MIFRNLPLALLLLASSASAETVALLPLVPEGVADEDRARAWWGGVLDGARGADGVTLKSDDGGSAEMTERVGKDAPGCLSDDECAGDLAGATGATHALLVRIAGDEGRVKLRLKLLTTDPVSVVRELVYDEATVGTDAEVALVTRGVRYVLAPLAKRSDRASITVTADVEGALIHIDGKGAGAVPFDHYDLAAGTHLIEVKTEGGASYRRLVDIPPKENALVEAVLTEPKAPKVSAGGDGLAWTAIGGGLGLAAVGGLGLVFSTFEAERLNGEIAEANDSGGFQGDDDPELVRIRGETLRTHIITASGIAAIALGVAAAGWGVTLFFDEE
jgi:hypothetical protein